MLGAGICSLASSGYRDIEATKAMHDMLYDIVTALVLALLAYGSTNIDNLILFAMVASGTGSASPVVTGYAIGTIVILLVSMSFSLLSLLVEPAYISLLGIVPLLLGLRLLFSKPVEAGGRQAVAHSAGAIAFLLVANSVDTMAVFGPMFAESERVVVISLMVGYLLTASAWLVAVIKVSRHAGGARTLARASRRVVPFVMILIGVYILADTWTDLQ